jgi:hypothetical protein
MDLRCEGVIAVPGPERFPVKPGTAPAVWLRGAPGRVAQRHACGVARRSVGTGVTTS